MSDKDKEIDQEFFANLLDFGGSGNLLRDKKQICEGCEILSKELKEVISCLKELNKKIDFLTRGLINGGILNSDIVTYSTTNFIVPENKGD